MNKVLILDGDAAHALAIMECLKANGYGTAVLCHDKNSYGYHSSLADERFLGPDSHKVDEYRTFVLKFLDEHKFDVLIPTSDITAEFMSFNKDILEKKAGVLMPSYDIFMKAYDKNQLMAVCRENSFPHPRTADLSKTDYNSSALSVFPYPALLKPNLTSGGRGMTLVRNQEELIKIYPEIHAQYGDCHLQQFIQPGGKQIKVQIFIDKNKDVKCSSVIWKQRYYPVRGGSSCCNVTVDNPEIVGICTKILRKINWVGFADFDLIENPQTGELLIMEINPRIPACVRSAFKSGSDYATMIADATLDRPLKTCRYSPGKRLRHLGFEVLWFLKSPDRFKTQPSWWKFFGKDTFYQDWLPGNLAAFVYGTWGNLKKQLNPEFRKAKSGVKI